MTTILRSLVAPGGPADISREFVVNSRHPDPWRAWKGGAEPQVVDQIIGIPGIPGIPGIRG